MTTLTPTTATRADRSAARGSSGQLSLLVHQIRFEQLSFWRNPQSMVFTFVLPIVIIGIFGAVFSGGSGETFFFGLTGMQYYTPTIAAVSVLGACYGQLAIVLAMRRQQGILKRLHAAPFPPGSTSPACWSTVWWSASSTSLWSWASARCTA